LICGLYSAQSECVRLYFGIPLYFAHLTTHVIYEAIHTFTRGFPYFCITLRSVTSLDQFAATLNLVEHRLTGEVYKGLPILTLSQIKRNELDGKAIELGVTEHQDAGDY